MRESCLGMTSGQREFPPDPGMSERLDRTFVPLMPTLNRVIALLADPARPCGTDRAAQRPKLPERVHHATHGAVPLARGQPR